MKAYIFLAGMIALMSVSQVLLKFAGRHAALHPGLIQGFLYNPWIYVALWTGFFGLCAWLMTLRRMPLSRAYAWTALIYLITPLASVCLFAETLNSRYILGLMLVLVGILTASRGVISQ